MAFLTKIKQIEGLNALLLQLAQEDIALGGKIGGITLGGVTLVGNELRLPFTDPTGTSIVRSIDLSALTTDVNIDTTSLTPEGILTITETDGQTHTIDLLAYVSNYVTTNVLPGIAQLETDVAAQEVRLDAVESDVTAIEGDITTLQGSVDALETGKADALDLYTKGQIDAQEVAQNLLIGQKADASAVYSKTATDNKDTEQNVAVQDVVDDAAAVVSQVSGLDTVVTALEGNRSYVLPDIAAQVTNADGQLATAYTLPAGVKYVTSVLVDGVAYSFGAKTQVCYFSKDNGATAVMTDLAGAKLYWNGSKAGMELDADDMLTIVVIGSLASTVVYSSAQVSRLGSYNRSNCAEGKSFAADLTPPVGSPATIFIAAGSYSSVISQADADAQAEAAATAMDTQAYANQYGGCSIDPPLSVTNLYVSGGKIYGDMIHTSYQITGPDGYVYSGVQRKRTRYINHQLTGATPVAPGTYTVTVMGGLSWEPSVSATITVP